MQVVKIFWKTNFELSYFEGSYSGDGKTVFNKAFNIIKGLKVVHELWTN